MTSFKKIIDSKLLKCSYEVIKDAGFAAFIELVREERKNKKIVSSTDGSYRKLNVKMIDLPDYKKNLPPLPVKVSFIIPTNSSVSKVRNGLDSIKIQKGIKDIEIILINS